MNMVWCIKVESIPIWILEIYYITVSHISFSLHQNTIFCHCARHLKMRSTVLHQSTEPTPERSHNNPNANNNINISTSSNLSISITKEPHTRHPPTYRAIKRADGVIVEFPKYQPSPVRYLTTNDPQQVQTTKSIRFILETPQTDGGRKTIAIPPETRMEDDLRGIRSFSPELRTCCGRDGYNGHCQIENAAGVGESMQRFLDEESGDGPWTPYSVHR